MRLINADWLLGELSNSWEKLRKKEIKHISITNLINNAPTAYDIDKVIEQLNEKSWRSYSDPARRKLIWVDEAIKIVKGGK